MAYKTKGTRPKNLKAGAEWEHPSGSGSANPESLTGFKRMVAALKDQIYEGEKVARNQKALEYIRAKNKALLSSTDELPVVNNEYNVGE